MFENAKKLIYNDGLIYKSRILKLLAPAMIKKKE